MSETREPWIVRDSVPEDESCIAYTWLKGYAHSNEVRQAGFRDAEIDGSPGEVRFWQVHQPIVTGLLTNATVRVACDPERATYVDGRPAVIWAWSCCDEDSVHWVMVKRSAIKAGLGPELVRALLGNRLETEHRTTFELVDLARMKLIPSVWKRDRAWLASLRSMSSRVLEGDAVYVAVGNHVLDLDRTEWTARDAA